PYASMNQAHANRRNAGDVPSAHRLRALSVGQIARRAADIDALQSRRLTIRRLDELPRRADRVDDAEEQRRGRLNADKCGIAGAIEVSDPHDEHVRAEHPGGPRVAEAPRCTGLPSDWHAAAALCVGIVRTR